MEDKKKSPALRFNGFTEDWETEEVGSYYEFKNGLNKGKEFFGYGKPIVNFTDVFHKRGLYANQLKGKVDVTSDEINNYSVKTGDLFFTRTSETIEEIGFSSVMLDEPENAVYSGFVLRARAIDFDPLEISFKKFAFNTASFRSEMVKKSSMTTRALTSGTAIKKMFFSFPKSKDEQRKIGDYITKIESLIEQHQKKHNKLATLKKSMLEKMFPQDGQAVPEIRFKGFEGAWEEKRIDELTTNTYGGGTPNTKNEDYWNGDIPWIQSSDLSEGKLSEVKPRKKITNEGLKNSATKIVPKNSIAIVTRVGVGKLAFMPFEYATSQDFLSLSELKTDDWFGAYSIWLRIQKELHSVQGTSIKGVTKDEVLSKILLIPKERSEQQKIGAYFQKIDTLISKYKKQLDKLLIFKQSLSEKMFV